MTRAAATRTPAGVSALMCHSSQVSGPASEQAKGVRGRAHPRPWADAEEAVPGGYSHSSGGRSDPDGSLIPGASVLTDR